VTYAEYRKIDAVNWSSLKAMAVSPLQYQYERMHPREETRYLRVGIAVHAHILEPHTFLDRFRRHEGSRRGKAWDAVRAEADAAGVTVLTEDEWDDAFGAAAAVLANPYAAAYLKSGLKEASFTWTDPGTGLLCKGRIDHAGSHLVDLKTAARIDQRTFAAAAARLGYHSQLAYYADGLAANGIKVDAEPILIVVQSSMPHDVIVYRIPPHVIEAGRAEYQRLLALLKHCRETNTWPGAAPDGPIEFELPAWATTGDGDDLNLTMGGEPLEGI